MFNIKFQSWSNLINVPPSPTSAHSIQWWQGPTYHSPSNLIHYSLHTADWCVVVCWSAQTHNTLRTSWAAGRQPPRQVKFIPPTCKYLATFHPRSSSLSRTSISAACMFPCSVEWTWSSVPRSTHPTATTLCMSTHNNATVYCKKFSSLDSEIHTSKILVVLLKIIITKICKSNECYGVRDFDMRLIDFEYCIRLPTLICTTWWWPTWWPKHVLQPSYPPSLSIDNNYSCV